MNTAEISQLWGMTKYEFKMHWRQRVLLVLMLAVGFMVIVSVLLIGGNLPTGIELGETAQEGATGRQVLDFTVVFTTWAPIGVMLAFILPIAVADTIPLDRQRGVSELLNTLPLSPAIYLAGKLLGMWAASVLGTTGILAIAGVAWWLCVGAFDVGLYVTMWLFGSVAQIILCGSFGLLVAGGQPTRRRAVVTAVMLLAIAFNLGGFQGGSWVAYLNPLRMPILLYFLSNPGMGTMGIANQFSVRFQDVLFTIGFGVVELVLLWAVVWYWMRDFKGRI